MTLAEQALHGREFEIVLSPHPIYCFKCHIIMGKGTLVQRYDSTMMTHTKCPDLPFRNVAIHRRTA